MPANLLRLGVSGTDTFVSDRPFNLGGAGTVTSVRPFNIEQPDVNVTSNRPFSILGGVSAVSVRPFNILGDLRAVSIRRFNIDENIMAPILGVYPGGAPVPIGTATFLTVAAPPGSVAITVNDTTGFSLGDLISVDGEIRRIVAPQAAPIFDPPSDPIFTPPTYTPPPSVTSIYGAAINIDTKANLQSGWTDNAKVAHRFMASTSSKLMSMRFQARGGPVYSGGDGGTYRISVQSDSGGSPSGTILASANYTPGNPVPTGAGWTRYDLVAFGSPATLAQGTIYHIVWENIAPDPVTNYFSVNEVFVYGSVLNPRQPAFEDAEYAVLYAAPSSWVLQGRYTADMDLTYADGSHDGQSYVQNMIDKYGVISGSSMVREHFTVTGGNRTFDSAYVRVRRSSGTDPLIITVKQGSLVLGTRTVVATDVPISAPGADNGGSVWVTVSFGDLTLTNGVTYDLVFSTAVGTTYTAAPIRSGADVDMHSFTFTDGEGQFTINGGSSWSPLYAFSPVNTQSYFVDHLGGGGVSTTIPGTVDDTGATDCSDDLMAYLNGLSSGTTVYFNPTGIYRIDKALKLHGLVNITLIGQGCRIEAHGSGFNEDYSLFYFQASGGGCTGIRVTGFNLIGNSPTPGVFISGHEGQHGVLCDGGSGFEIDHNIGSGFFGDMVEVNGGSSNGRIHDNTCTNTGRNAVSVIWGNHWEIDHNSFPHSGYMPFDIEPNNNTQPSNHINFHNNTTGYWTNAWFALDGSHTGAAISDISITDNTSLGKSLLSVVNNGTGGSVRNPRITFTGNTSNVSASGPVLQFQHVDVLVVQHNVQPLSSGSLVSTSDCTATTLTPNP